MRPLLHLMIASAILATPASAQSRTAVAATTALPPGPTRTVQFTTEEGTWMSVDVSPDGATIVFDLLGDLYTVPISGGHATRLTSGLAFDTEPVFSPDGRRIAFVSDRSGNDNIWFIDADGRNLRPFTHDTAGDVTGPERINGGEFVLAAQKPDGYWMYRADGTTTVLLATLPGRALTRPGDVTWSRDGRFMYAADRWRLWRVDVARGTAEVVNQRRPDAFRPAVSPDGQWLVFGSQRENQTGLRLLNLATDEERWLIHPLPDRDNSMVANRSDGLRQSGGLRPPAALPRFAFVPDGTAIVLATGGMLQRLDLRTGALRPIRFRATVEQELRGRATPAQALPPGPGQSAGALALEGAMVITMRGTQVLRDATVVVRGRRIVAVGRRGALALPADVRRIDVRGKVIMPGLIDLRGDTRLAAHLAFGVTTVRAFAAVGGAPDSASSAAGARLLPGAIMGAAQAGELSGLDAARRLVRARQAQGATALLHTGALARRQRQWLAAAAHEAGLPLAGEPGQLRLALTMAADGYQAIHGTIPNAQLYDDVRGFFAAAHTVYVPILLAATGGRRSFGLNLTAEQYFSTGTAEEYFLEQTDVRADPKLRRFGLDSVGPLAWRLHEDYHFFAVGRQARRLAARGVPVSVGTAGKRPGLGVHWELWALGLSGVAPHAALRAATATAAAALGLGDELGTVEVGKVADLVVLDADPLTDLTASRATRYVLRDGELFDASTLARLWPRPAPPPVLRDPRYDPPAVVARDEAGERALSRAPGASATLTGARAVRQAAVPAQKEVGNAAGSGLPITPARTIAFETTEGTLMNVDVSPDGRTIAFDLLGDLYTVPVDGGAATQLTRGLSVDRRPVWSPDGRHLAFMSDETGYMEVWIVGADGTGRRLGPGPQEREFARGVEWVPDGPALVSGDTITDLSGGKRALPEISGNMQTPRFSPDGRYFYYSPGRAGGVHRHDRRTGATTPLATVPVEYCEPVLSPDGRWLAYVTCGPQGGGRTNGLRVRNLATGEDRWLAYPMDQWRSVFERYTFTPDSRAIIIGYGGRLHRLDVVSGADRVIPFTARVNVELGRFVYHRRRLPTDSVTARYVGSATVSPDGKTVAFSALRRVYTMALPGGTPRPLVAQAAGQHQPAYSPDGQWIAYVTWDDVEGGHVWRVPAAGGPPTRLTSRAAYYQRPTWSPDGTMLAILRRWTLEIALGSETRATLQLLPSTGGPPRTVATEVNAESPVTFAADGQRLLFQESDRGSGEGPTIVSVRLDGSDRRALTRVAPYGPELTYGIPSPDGCYLAYVRYRDLYLTPFAETLDSAARGHSAAAVRLAHAPLDLRWARDSRTLTWVVGNQVSRINAAATLASRQPSGDVIPIRLTAPRHGGRGVLALRGARVVTMRGAEVLERGTVVITNDRITAIGPTATVPIPPGATVLDVAGKTIIPGLVDLHAHYGRPSDVFLQSYWKHLAALAYGVTTARDPSADTEQVGHAELIETGRMIGPRLFSVGWAMTPAAAAVSSLDDARAIVQQRKAIGAVAIKQYDQLLRRQRQWLLLAADEAGLNATNEGERTELVLSMVLDGFTGWEHSVREVGLYGDFTQLIAEAKTWYTPTLVAVYGGEGAIYFRDRYRALYQDPKYRRFVPQYVLDSRRDGELRRPGYNGYLDFIDASRRVAEIVHRGGHVALGSHGDDQGLGVHWELWALQLGGLTNHEALRVATLRGAEGLGLQDDLGSLEVGKLADLLVLDQNPLEHIEHSLTLRYVMKGGVLRDAATLAEVWPERRALPAWMYQDDPRQRRSAAPIKARGVTDY